MILSFIGETDGTDVKIPLCEGIEINIKERGGPNGRGHGGMALILWLLTGIDIVDRKVAREVFNTLNDRGSS